MGQTIKIEIDDNLPIREQEAEQIASLIYTIANTDEGIARLELELESEALLNITPLAGVDGIDTRDMDEGAEGIIPERHEGDEPVDAEIAEGEEAESEETTA